MSVQLDAALVVDLQALQGPPGTGPELLQTRAYQVGGKAASQQEGPELLDPALRLVPQVQAPVLLGQALDHGGLRDLLQGLRQAVLDQGSGHAAADQLGAQTVAPETANGETGPGETLRITLIVQIPFAAELLQGGLDLVPAGAPPKQRAPELLLRAVSLGQEPQGAVIGGELGSRAADRYSTSKDCMVFSISSAAMSEVDWMPWIFSLNSSGLLARRSASS